MRDKEVLKKKKEDKFEFIEATHTYLLNGAMIPSVTEVLSAEGFYKLDSISPQILERARKYGIALHKTCELFDKNILDWATVSEPLIKPMNQWARFQKDYKTNFLEIEKHMYSPKYRFGFTCDRIGLVLGKLTILDIKSTTNVDKVSGLQLAAYKIGYTDLTKIKVKQKWIIKLSDEKYEVFPIKDSFVDEQVFISALNVHYWKQNNLKNA